MKNGYFYHLLYILADVVISYIVVVISFLSYYGVYSFGDYLLANLLYAAGISIATVTIFFAFKVYKIITHEIGIFESIRIIFATLLVQVIGLIVVAFVPFLPNIGSFIFPWLLSTATLVFFHPFLRIVVRVFNLANVVRQKTVKVRTIIIGAGAMGKVVVDESRRNKNNHNQIVAIVDDNPNKIGGLFANIPVKGPISNIATIIDFYRAKEVIIAMSRISKERLHEILQLLSSCHVQVRRMPLIAEMEGPNDKRIIGVDLEDLLARELIILDNKEIKEMLRNEVVLVTGAGGTIGSELVRQIFNARPKTIILFDIYENSTYDIQMELVNRIRQEKIKDFNLVTLIGSTYNEKRVEQIFKKYKPDYVYHAAAYKHVPLMEDSPAEAIRTNVIGTYNIAKMADKYGTKKMVLVSTDKAVRPTNVMGATKRFAEMIIQYFSEHSATKYAAVRFGNVLGSNGSVVPLFKKQIEAGGPITLTDKRIIRYFMTVQEAVSLILQCGLFADGGEIFILDMGKPVKILDLAERLIRQSGLIPNVDIHIIETGLRPGEKLYEELLLNVEHQKKTSNSRIYVEEKELVKPIEKEIEEISEAFDMENEKDVKTLLSKVVDSYTITENK
jgi:FlaA1/EpsC-like NDP-sugar epimerase